MQHKFEEQLHLAAKSVFYSLLLILIAAVGLICLAYIPAASPYFAINILVGTSLVPIMLNIKHYRKSLKQHIKDHGQLL